MDNDSLPQSPFIVFKDFDDNTGELFDEGSATQGRKRRRASLRRVSFAEEPSIHIFARDDDYETPPEGTTSHLSGNSTPTISMSPLSLIAVAGEINDKDKENVPVGRGATGRGAFVVEDKEKEKLLKRKNLNDDREMSDYGSCDENTGPVDLRHISFTDPRMSLDNDDNITMDSQTFQTRMSLMHMKQPRHAMQPFSGGKFVDTATPLNNMDITVFSPERRKQQKLRSTWHRGDDSPSDMSLVSFEEKRWWIRSGEKKGRSRDMSEDFADDSCSGQDNILSQETRPEMQMENVPSLSTATVPKCTTLRVHQNEEVVGNRGLPSSEFARKVDVSVCKDTNSLSTPLQSEASHVVEHLTSSDSVRHTLKEMPHVAANKLSRKPSEREGADFVNLGTSCQEKARLDGRMQFTVQYDDTASLASSSQHQTSQQKIDSGGQDSTSQGSKSMLYSRRPLGPKIPRDANLRERTPQSALKKDVTFPADDDTVSMDISNTQMTLLPRMSGECGQSFNTGKILRTADLDTTADLQDRITQTIPLLTDLLNDHDPGSPTTTMPTEGDTLPLASHTMPRNSSNYLLQADVESSEALNPASKLNNHRELGSSVREAEDVVGTIQALEQEKISNNICEESTVLFDAGIGQKARVFENALDTFSFRVLKENFRQETRSEGLKEIAGNQASGDEEMAGFEPASPRVWKGFASTESNFCDNRRANGNQLTQQSQSDDMTRDITDESKRMSDSASDMSLTPLSDNPIFLQKVRNKGEIIAVQSEAGFVDSPSLEDGITGPIPSVKDCLAADEVTPNSAWNPKRISWSEQQGTCQTLSGTSDPMRRPAIDETEDTTVHSLSDKIHTLQAQHAAREKDNDSHQSTDEVDVNLISRLSHTEEVKNNTANRMMQRLVWLRNKEPMETEPLSVEDSPDIKQWTLNFQSQVDSQGEVSPQDRKIFRELEEAEGLRSPPSESKISKNLLTPMRAPSDLMDRRDPLLPGASKVNKQQDDEEAISTERRSQDSITERLARELQVAEEKLAALKKQSITLSVRAQEHHQAIGERCMGRGKDRMAKSWEAKFDPQAHVDKLRSRCLLHKCMQFWNLTTTKNEDHEVVYTFKYWSLLTHSVLATLVDNLTLSLIQSKVELNMEAIDQVFRHTNASVAWKAFLSGQESVLHPMHNLQIVVQAMVSKVAMLLDLMEEVNKCRKHLVIPQFRLASDGGLEICLRFSNREPLLHFEVILDLRSWLSQKEMDCKVEIEVAGRSGTEQVTSAEIKDCVASATPGHLRLSRICASISSFIEMKQVQPASAIKSIKPTFKLATK